MVKIELETSTLAVLIAGLYSVRYNVNAMAIPESVYLQVAEKLEHFLENNLWDFKKLSFEDWVNTCLWIYPKPLISDAELDDMKKTTLYWEVPNGNVILVVSMNIGDING